MNFSSIIFCSLIECYIFLSRLSFSSVFFSSSAISESISSQNWTNCASICSFIVLSLPSLVESYSTIDVLSDSFVCLSSQIFSDLSASSSRSWEIVPSQSAIDRSMLFVCCLYMRISLQKTKWFKLISRLLPLIVLSLRLLHLHQVSYC